MDRKKELKEQYKQYRPEMGLISAKCRINGRIYIEATNRTQASINKLLFTLKLGSNRCEELQKDWKEYGEGSFHIEVLENLEYDEKDPDRDYCEDLEILKLEWVEKFRKDNVELY